MGGKYRVVKVFDCQDMSDELRGVFFEMNEGQSNDSYVGMCVYDECESCGVDEFESVVEGKEVVWKECDGEKVRYIVKGRCKVSDWLVENGAEIGDDVMINHWW